MTVDIRTAAEAEAVERWPLQDPSIWHDADLSNFKSRSAFADGAVWAAARVTPTREQLAGALGCALTEFRNKETHPRLEDQLADAVLALVQELAEGEKDG